MIGPHRGGRTKAAAGIPDRPSVFYVGACNGGVWKTDDYGRTWTPIFDDQPTGSIGAIAIAPSNPDVLYVGSGEGLQRPDLSTGDGIYKSTDGGRTWRHLGLRNGRQIPQIVVDPHDPNRLLVAVLGSPYGPGPERGVFRSTDGGETFEKVLYRDEDTGAVDVVLDPADARTAYAVLWEARQAPWENGTFNGPGSGLYKTTDGGTTWRPIGRACHLAEDGLGRIGITVAPSDPRAFSRPSSQAKAGLYRSDDAGETWTLINADPRVTDRASDFAEVKVHPQDPDTVFTASIVTWKSRTAAARSRAAGPRRRRLPPHLDQPAAARHHADRGRPGRHHHRERRPHLELLVQPATAQLYHVSTDSAFPYRVCGASRRAGPSASRAAATTADHVPEWSPVGVEEYGFVAVDPLDPTSSTAASSAATTATKQTQTIAPRPVRPAEGYRVLRTEPVLFSPRTRAPLRLQRRLEDGDGGRTWTAISPTSPPRPGRSAQRRQVPDTEAARPTQRGVIYTLAPSPLDGQRMWAGTDDGLVHVTTDGGTSWTEVTPEVLRDRPWSKISLLEASHFDGSTAYAAVNTFRLDDLRPHVYRTRDLGRTWTEITAGLPDGAVVNAVREDPQRRGLLLAGTEQAVFVSFDDGESWQSLRINMPATSIRDLVIKDDDLVVGTHGRSFWILDDITPLRQITPSSLQEAAVLFRPQEAWRFRWNKNTDTPLPPDEPAGQNPPDGAIVHYFLKTAAARPVVLEVLDAAGTVVRRYRSDDVPEPPVEGRNIPDYWIRPPQVLSAQPGLHRFVWDLRHAPPAAASFSYPIAAVTFDTPREPRGPWAVPGTYTVRLTVDGRTLTQPLRLKMDPRVRTSPEDLGAQIERSLDVARAMARTRDGIERVTAEKARAVAGPAAEALSARATTLSGLGARLLTLYEVLQEADAGPTPAALETAEVLRGQVTKALMP